MPTQFHENGIAFRYPENWTIEREEHPSGWAVTIQSPDTAFLTVTFHGDAPDITALCGLCSIPLRRVPGSRVGAGH